MEYVGWKQYKEQSGSGREEKILWIHIDLPHVKENRNTNLAMILRRALLKIKLIHFRRLNDSLDTMYMQWNP
jgi:hypothetical protein